MRLSYNLASMNIYKEHTKNVKAQSTALNRITSGYKINNASENPNAIAQSEKLRMQIRGLQMAQRNVQDGASMLQTADGALDSITSMLHRIKELTVQAGGALTSEDKAVVQTEINQMKEAIGQTAKNTEFNGVKLICNEEVSSIDNPKFIFMPSGANVDERIQVPMFNLTPSKLRNADGTMSLQDLDVTVPGGIDKALGMLDSALESVLSVRSKYGALENRFQSSFESVSAIGDTLQKSESELRDADIAEEMMNFAKHGILLEAGNAMMVQSNRFPQDILRILENVRG